MSIQYLYKLVATSVMREKKNLESVYRCLKILKREMELSEKKNVEKLRSLQLDNKAFAMKELEGNGSQPAGILFRGHVAMSAMVSDCHSGVCVGGTAGI